MPEQRGLMPSGISRSQFAALTKYSEVGQKYTTEQLQKGVHRHLEETRSAHARNRLVNLRLAEAMGSVFETLFDRWGDIPEGHRGWLAGAIVYFYDSNDDEPDFSSALGFEDDAEILNSCLKHAGMESLCIVIEDYDDA